MSDMRRLLDPDQVAEIVGLSALTIRRALRAGELPGHKIRNRWRVDPADVADWIDSHRHTPPGTPAPAPPARARPKTHVPAGGFRELARREAQDRRAS